MYSINSNKAPRAVSPISTESPTSNRPLNPIQTSASICNVPVRIRLYSLVFSQTSAFPANSPAGIRACLSLLRRPSLYPLVHRLTFPFSISFSSSHLLFFLFQPISTSFPLIAVERQANLTRRYPLHSLTLKKRSLLAYHAAPPYWSGPRPWLWQRVGQASSSA